MTEKLKQIIDLAAGFCEAHYNPVQIAKYARYFREGFDAYGLTDKELEQIISDIQDKYNPGIPEILELGLHLFQTGKFELGSIAIYLLRFHKKHFTREVFEGIRKWFDHGVGNWGHSDSLSCRELTALLENKIVTYQDFEDWKTSPSRWTRRAAPVSMICLRKTEKPEALLAFLDDMMHEKERVVHQGLGWFLRELWKIHPQPVELFLFKHLPYGARLIYQYATERMSKEYREKFRHPPAT